MNRTPPGDNLLLHLRDTTNRRPLEKHDQPREGKERPAKKRRVAASVLLSQEKNATILIPKDRVLKKDRRKKNHRNTTIVLGSGESSSYSTTAKSNQPDDHDADDKTVAALRVRQESRLLERPRRGQRRNSTGTGTADVAVELAEANTNTNANLGGEKDTQPPPAPAPPPTKKSNTTKESGRAGTSTPYDLWESQFQTFLSDHGFLGSVLIRGLEAIGASTSNGRNRNRNRSEKPRCFHNGPEESGSSSSHSADGPVTVGSSPARTRRSELLSKRGILVPDYDDGPRDDDGDDDGLDERSILSRQDLKSFRYILMTEYRADKLEQVRDWLLVGEEEGLLLPGGKEDEERLVVYYDQHGSFARQVIRVWDRWRRLLFNVKSQALRLDWLVAFTHTLHEFDMWMYDDPDACDDDADTIELMVKSVAAFWKRLFLKERDEKADLGWDSEYTKPGVLELLRQFKAKVEACPALGVFDYSI